MTDLRLGDGCVVDDTVDVPSSGDGEAPRIGDDATVRSGTIIYPDVVVGDGLQTGHHVVVREQTVVGDDVVLGTKTVLDGRCEIGDGASLQTGVYVPPYSDVGDRVFLGPNAVLTNDPYPLRQDCDLVGPTLGEDVSVGANATILPDVTVGDRSFVAAGSVVTEDVPPETLAIGVPAEHRPLPPALDATNLQE
ncbi:N-acetyltransferase [Halobacteria archaeon HArc-gm2]|nr:N-acetyltransferase [Halobacteria archaeon HArc-gm2]